MLRRLLPLRVARKSPDCGGYETRELLVLHNRSVRPVHRFRCGRLYFVKNETEETYLIWPTFLYSFFLFLFSRNTCIYVFIYVHMYIDTFFFFMYKRVRDTFFHRETVFLFYSKRDRIGIA